MVATAPLVTAQVEDALGRAAARHDRPCPRQVLGVRMGIAAAEALGLAIPASDHRLLALVETDGCFVDGIEAATGCSLGHRTLRLYDCGRVAATFVDVDSGRAVRVAPRPDVRERAGEFAPDEYRRFYAQLDAYQVMPDDELLHIEEVALEIDLVALLGQKGVRVDCVACGEEIINGREQRTAAGPLCPACVGGMYYRRR